ncbi:hypothetical protein M758_1G270400 [Ceratodon purpureus]|nr:hypothetical protein M758_1G270400 [Ceratodon purpureus]
MFVNFSHFFSLLSLLEILTGKIGITYARNERFWEVVRFRMEARFWFTLVAI